MQITFDADTAEGALAQEPSEIVLFQHGGGERGGWDDRQGREGGGASGRLPCRRIARDVLLVGVFIGNGQGGSGSAATTLRRRFAGLDRQPLLVPTVPAPGRQFQWLTYTGRWGQKEKGFNNGPTGPTTKEQWLQPFAWMDGVRRASPKVPGGPTLGPAVSTAFCAVAANLSGYYNYATRTLAGAIVLAVVLLLIVLVPIKLTRWRPVDLANLRRPRAVGQLLRAARQLYGRHWRTLVLIGLTTVPIILLSTDFRPRRVARRRRECPVHVSAGHLPVRAPGPESSAGRSRSRWSAPR